MSIIRGMIFYMPTPEPRAADADEQFVASVRALRAEAGMSQEQLAEALKKNGVDDATQVTVSRMEAGKRHVRLGEALALSEIFQVPISALTRPSGAALSVAAASRAAKVALHGVTEFQEAVKQLALVKQFATESFEDIDDVLRREDLSPDLLANATRSRSYLRQVAEYDAPEDVSRMLQSLNERENAVAKGAPPIIDRHVFSYTSDGTGREIE
jgi:transcriptional regulator with XRE-family HTH domain